MQDSTKTSKVLAFASIALLEHFPLHLEQHLLASPAHRHCTPFPALPKTVHATLVITHWGQMRKAQKAIQERVKSVLQGPTNHRYVLADSGSI